MAGDFIPVKAPRGRVSHYTTTGAVLAGITLCGVPCDGFAVVDFATCKKCLAKVGAPR